MSTFQVGDRYTWENTRVNGVSYASHRVIIKRVLPNDQYEVEIVGKPYRLFGGYVLDEWDLLGESKPPKATQSALQRARDAEAELDRLRAAKAWDKAEAQEIIFRARVIDFYRESVREADKK